MFNPTMFRSIVKRSLSRSVLQRSFSLKTQTYKSTTGLVGIAVDTNARNTLMNLTNQCLESVKECPEGTGYRQSVEEWMHFIQKGVMLTEDVKAIEEFIDLGQIEEVIGMVKDEINLTKEYIAAKGWELCDESDVHATEWYEFKAEDLHYAGVDDHIGEDEESPTEHKTPQDKK